MILVKKTLTASGKINSETIYSHVEQDTLEKVAHCVNEKVCFGLDHETGCYVFDPGNLLTGHYNLHRHKTLIQCSNPD